MIRKEGCLEAYCAAYMSLVPRPYLEILIVRNLPIPQHDCLVSFPCSFIRLAAFLAINWTMPIHHLPGLIATFESFDQLFSPSAPKRKAVIGARAA